MAQTGDKCPWISILTYAFLWISRIHLKICITFAIISSRGIFTLMHTVTGRGTLIHIWNHKSSLLTVTSLHTSFQTKWHWESDSRFRQTAAIGKTWDSSWQTFKLTDGRTKRREKQGWSVLTLAGLFVCIEIISIITRTYERAGCVNAIVLTATFVYRAFINV